MWPAPASIVRSTLAAPSPDLRGGATGDLSARAPPEATETKRLNVASTQASLRGVSADVVDDPGSLDFDLGTGDADETGDDEVLDLTANTDPLTDGEEILDLTADMEEFGMDGEDALDFTSDSDESSGEQNDVQDIGATAEIAGADDVLDLTLPAPAGDHDFLDITKTGGSLVGDKSDDLLNVTSPGLNGVDEPVADEETIASAE